MKESSLAFRRIVRALRYRHQVLEAIKAGHCTRTGILRATGEPPAVVDMVLGQLTLQECLKNTGGRYEVIYDPR